MSEPRRLLLLTRPDCHLCEELRGRVEALLGRTAELREACVDDRADWRQAYGRRIPVVLDAHGRVLAEGRPQDAELEAGLRGGVHGAMNPAA